MPASATSASTAFVPLDPLTLTATAAAEQLECGSLTSEALVLAYLAQIEKHNHSGQKLNALISICPRETLLEIAKTLDAERRDGKLRGPLHGVPFIVKDVFLTHPSLGMPTTVGGPCFASAKAKRTAPLIQHLLDRGLILLGKANLTEFCGLKHALNTVGWSPMGGQTQNPYVFGGLEPGEKMIGNSISGGSSSGSAVSVAAGFAPLAIGTECNGSVINPVGRNALYGLKIGPDGVNADAAFRYTDFCDCVGAMGKCANDVKLLASTMMETTGAGHFTGNVGFTGMRVGWLDAEVWSLPDDFCGWPGDTRKQMEKSYAITRRTLTAAGATVLDLKLPSTNETLSFEDGKDAIREIASYQIPKFLAKFVDELSETDVRSFEDIIKFNEEHADICLPPELPHQGEYHDLIENPRTHDDCEMRRASVFQRSRAILDPIFAEHDVIVGWADSRLVTYSSTARFPVACVPMAMMKYSEVNERPFGLAAIAKDEHTLLQFMAAYEKAMPPRPLPRPLLGDNIQ